MKRLRSVSLLLGLFLGTLGATDAELSLPRMFGDHMVLQRGQPIPVWGWAAPGAKVTVKLAGREATATADSAGKWRTRLPSTEAGGPHQFTVTSGQTITFDDVLIGDVWLCSGQSNMDNNYPGVLGNTPESVRARIRLFRVGAHTAAVPEPDLGGGEWTPCEPRYADAFSATGMYFGLEIQPKIGVPLGLIHSAFGATCAEEWTSREVQMANPELRGACEGLDKQAQEFATRCRAFLPEARVWQHAYERARAKGGAAPLPPIPPADPRAARTNPSVFYNGMIAPLAPYGLRGVVWYQGEWNTGPGAPRKYRTLFPVLIQSWRKLWGQGDPSTGSEQAFPFLYVQLPTFITNNPTNHWAALREAQTLTLGVTNTAMAVTMDNPNPADLHPWNKPDVGKRLGLNALALVYGQKVVCTGPRFESMKAEGNKVRIRFRDVGGGLATKNNEPLKGFAVAGKDRVFAWAQAAIEKDNVLVSADSVREPVAVRYAWADAPWCNLFNQEGLPAWPFRTDSWDDVTAWPKEGSR